MVSRAVLPKQLEHGTQPSEPSSEKALRILLIEDSPQDVALLREMLSESDLPPPAPPRFELVNAPDLQTGLTRLEEPFDVILLDLSLPDASGFECVARVLGHTTRIPIIVMTGLDDRQVAARAVKMGAQDFLLKGSVDGPEVERAIRYAMERHHMVRELQAHIDRIGRNELRFRTIIEQSRDGIVLVNTTGVIEFVNPAAETMFGKSSDELVGCPFKLWSSLDSPERGEVVFEGPGGARSIAEVRSIRTEWDGKEVFLVNMRDVTERKQMEEEKRALENQVLQAQKLESLGVMVGGVAHDFNNILLIIQGGTELVKDRLEPDSPSDKIMDRIMSASQRAAALVKQMLDYAKRSSLTLVPFDVRTLIQDLSPLIETAISKKADVNYQLRDSATVIEGDANGIKQVVMNLVLNASEALGDLNGEVTLSIGTTQATRPYLASTCVDDKLEAGEYAFLEISDTGCGMDENTRSKMFDPFFSTKFQGRGLGLASVLGIVRAHRGAVKVESEPGRGTTVRVLFPLSTRTEVSDVTSRPRLTEENPAGRHWQGHGTVLLVDDEPNVRDSVRQSLEKAGFTVLGAGNGIEALQIFKKEGATVDFVITDLAMPRMNGVDVLREIHELRPGFPVVLITGLGHSDSGEEFIKKGFVGVIPKPFTQGKLLGRLKEILEGTGLVTEGRP